MNLKELKELVRKGEGQHLEFKLKASHPDKIIKEMVAFANSEGGQVLIGVNDDLQIPGLKFSEDDEYVLEKEIIRHISPELNYTMDRIKLPDEREVLIYNIPESEQKPHFIDFRNGEHPKAYVRVSDRSVQASREVREILKGRKKQKELRFSYGEKEDKLMKYLDIHKSITVSEYASLVQIPPKIASRTLILLTLTNVLKCIPAETEDRFEMV